ncbi:SIR2-like domain-containing protein [Paenibacillus algorifonticola]|uniref:SIR2-like domain-containing protein n=1 Tax=Paenibacillus algorifonticola TaxID=684063 RepID=A0A1I2DPC5_9BACL|nr:SIR2 family protein [Paenibacillus algorifonticola]SFE82366.1 SIR2-like domain-containing protein [Paenibacillus algorifonticola]
MSNIHLDDLKHDYLNNQLVPFIGAGLSIPFNIPDWKDLIRLLAEKYAVGDSAFAKDAVEWDLKRHNYWGAIDALKNYTTIIEDDIKSNIANLINKRKEIPNDDSAHNYSDLQKMKFALYLTTNYEDLLSQYLKHDISTILLKDIQFNTQEVFGQRRVLQLHGSASNSGSIVISKESYQELYENKKYDNIMKIITGSKKLLFMGFSFDDQFIRTLIKQHKKYFSGQHYIVLANPTNEKIMELKKEYGLLTIPYYTDSNSHTVEIRKILQSIDDSVTVTKKETNDAPHQRGFIQITDPLKSSWFVRMHEKKSETVNFPWPFPLKSMDPMPSPNDLFVIQEKNKNKFIIGVVLDFKININIEEIWKEQQLNNIDCGFNDKMELAKFTRGNNRVTCVKLKIIAIEDELFYNKFNHTEVVNLNQYGFKFYNITSEITKYLSALDY